MSRNYCEEENERREKLKCKVENATEELIDALNKMGREDEVAEIFFQTVTHSHRTLQANTVRLISKFLEKYSNLENTDARNQGAVAWAKVATENTKNMGIPFI